MSLGLYFINPIPLYCVLSLQRSAVLENIWNQTDTWPTSMCRAFILQWASMLESKVLLWALNRCVAKGTRVGFMLQQLV